MSDIEPIARGPGAQPVAPRTQPERVTFSRAELNLILALYGQMVAAGEWRDYAFDCARDVAVFAIYRRASEAPLYRIEKRPKLRNRQGAFAVIAASGFVLKRGHELAPVLRVFDSLRRTLSSV